VLSQFTSADGKACLKDYIDVPGVYAAGRLDWDSEGLLLLTDDGPLIRRVAAPEAKLPKTYRVQVEGVPSDDALRALRAGVVIEGRRTLPADAARFPDGGSLPPRDPPIRARRHIPTSWIELTLTEGRNRQVRKMTAAVGHPTLRLIRFAIGPFTLAGLEPGRWREIPAAEIRRDLPTFAARSR
jgi:23S rRNA pseudouridine2457 synthase